MADEPNPSAPAPDATPGGPPDLTAPPAAPPAPAVDAWREAIPPEYTTEKVWEQYAGKPIGEVLKAHAEQGKLLGRAITMPGKDAKPEDVATWKETQLPKLVAAGLVQAPPTAPTAYELKPHGISSIPPFNDQRVEFYKDKFHAAGMTQQQAQAMVDAHAEDLFNLVKASDASNLAMIEGLRKEWGDLLFEERESAALRGVKAVATKMAMDMNQLEQYWKDTRKGNDPILFQLFAGVGEAIGEDSSIGVEVAGVGGPTQARSEIDRIEASDAYTNSGHPGHADAVARRENLYKLIFGTGKADPATVLGRASG
jgi:hypothetical protein